MEDDVNLEQLKEQYETHRVAALALCEKAAAEDRSLTEKEQADLDTQVEKAKALKAKIDETERGLRAMEVVDQLVAIHGGTKDGATLSLKNAETSHPWATAITKAAEMMGAKAFSMPSGSIPLPALSTVPFSLGQLGAPLVQAVGLRPWPADGGRAVTYLRQTGRTNRAAIWHYGAAADGSDTPTKPVTDLATVAVEANAEVIAHMASPVKRIDLADFGGLQQWVQSELNYGLLQALEAAVLTAAGPEPDMQGLLSLPWHYAGHGGSGRGSDDRRREDRAREPRVRGGHQRRDEPRRLAGGRPDEDDAGCVCLRRASRVERSPVDLRHPDHPVTERPRRNRRGEQLPAGGRAVRAGERDRDVGDDGDGVQSELGLGRMRDAGGLDRPPARRHRNRGPAVTAKQKHGDAARLAAAQAGLPPDVHDPAMVAAYQAFAQRGEKAEPKAEPKTASGSRRKR
jgi:hypothetical protein